MTKIMVLPDCQIRPGDDVQYLNKIGHYMVDKRPDVVVCIGDFADMPSLSSYDVGKKSFEGKRYKADVQAVHLAMQSFLEPLWSFNGKAKKNKERQYHPRMVLTCGNHEARITRAVNDDPKLDGVLSIDDLKYEEFGWEVYPFRDVVVINDVAFSHFFETGQMGRPCTTASAMLNKKHMSTVAGHQQGLQIATAHKADGTRLTGIIAGSCYQHDEDYMSAQGNKHWRGFLMLHDVSPEGQFDLMPVSLDFIEKRYA